ncbi:hypothetical protein HGRIS_008565 [Hohenbuehelia grisea]|uniref:Alcohol dehydrogenase-like C-terminal domain-containing protein n=1 Tax=Hohenbuehelia grisea TaxID=104357 RepID=A0ABR3J9U5_9AGAR
MLPIPESFPILSPPPLASEPILIYGGGSLVGQYMVKVLHAAGYANIITTASPKHHELLRALGAAYTFDYHSPTLVADIAKTVGGDGKVKLVMDPIAAKASLSIIGGIIDPQGTLAVLAPLKEGSSITVGSADEIYISFPPHWDGILPKDLKVLIVSTGRGFEKVPHMRDNVMHRILPQLLESGIIKPSRSLLVDQGSLKDRALKGLDLLRKGQVSGKKLVIKIA